MPTWTDIGGFWVSAGGFTLSIILAIVGWVQAHGARGDAKTAKDQANAARRIADEAQRQTAAAEEAAEAARKQAAAAVAAFEWDTVPRLEVLANHDYMCETRTTKGYREDTLTSDWYVSNTGKAAAIRLEVTFDFGPNQIQLAPLTTPKLDGGSYWKVALYRVAMPPYDTIRSTGFSPSAKLRYTTPTGESRTEIVEVLPHLNR